jgi:hypothetical protein
MLPRLTLLIACASFLPGCTSSESSGEIDASSPVEASLLEDRGSRHDVGSSYTQALFAALHAAGVDLLLSGHYHWYERFRPQDPTGAVDAAKGVRQFIVGTGGSLHMINSGGWVPNSETHLEGTFGVLQLSLRPDRYDWKFLPEAGKQGQTDSGSDLCH